LLAERVESSVVEDDGGDGVRHVPLRRRDAVDDEAVRPAIVAEVRQPGEPPVDERREPRERRGENDGAHAATHSSRFRLRTRAIAMSTTTGYAIEPTTSMESATSG